MLPKTSQFCFISLAVQKLQNEAGKFAIVGAVNFALTFILFTTLLKVLEVNYLLSLLVAWIVGIFFSYIFNFSWVFKTETKIRFKSRFPKFILASVLSIGLNLLILHYLVEGAGYDPFYVQLALIPFIAVFNFSTAKCWSLRPSSNRGKTPL